MKKLKQISKDIRIETLELCAKHNASHIGSSLSVIDILTTLFYQKIYTKQFKDLRIFFSKGHASSAYYSTLNYFGFLKEYDLLNDFTKNGSYFTSHINEKIPGVEISTGSLGHALSVSVGLALALKKQKIKKSNVVTILSDGELQEGSNWEAILFAPKHDLNNLTIYIDYNKLQSFGWVKDIIPLEPITNKFLAFNWDVMEINGHSHNEILSTLKHKSKKPKVVIAHTIKGKGVDFMENKLEWHYKSPNQCQLIDAIKQIQEK